MTVGELILALEKYPRDLPVVYRRFSEQLVLDADDIKVEKLCAEIRPDGWVHHARPDKPSAEYLVFPGN